MSFAPGDIKWPMKSCENSVMGELCLWLPERTAVIVSHLHPFFDLFFVILKHFASFFISSHRIFSFINISRRYTRLKKTQNNILVPSLPVRDSSVFYIRRCATPVHNNLAKEDSLL